MIVNIAGYNQEVYTEEDMNQARAEALRDAAKRVCLLDGKLPAFRRSAYEEGYGDALNDAEAAILAGEVKE